jgi:hypothetical protein
VGGGTVETAAVIGLVVEGEQQMRRFPVHWDNGLLERIHEKACASLAFAEKLDLVLDEDLVAVDAGGEPGLQGSLTVTRKAAEGPVELTGTRGSVLYDVVLPDGPAVSRQTGDRCRSRCC